MNYAGLVIPTPYCGAGGGEGNSKDSCDRVMVGVIPHLTLDSDQLVCSWARVHADCN